MQRNDKQQAVQVFLLNSPMLRKHDATLSSEEEQILYAVMNEEDGHTEQLEQKETLLSAKALSHETNAAWLQFICNTIERQIPSSVILGANLTLPEKDRVKNNDDNKQMLNAILRHINDRYKHSLNLKAQTDIHTLDRQLSIDAFISLLSFQNNSLLSVFTQQTAKLITVHLFHLNEPNSNDLRLPSNSNVAFVHHVFDGVNFTPWVQPQQATTPRVLTMERAAQQSQPVPGYAVASSASNTNTDEDVSVTPPLSNNLLAAAAAATSERAESPKPSAASAAHDAPEAAISRAELNTSGNNPFASLKKSGDEADFTPRTPNPTPVGSRIGSNQRLFSQLSQSGDFSSLTPDARPETSEPTSAETTVSQLLQLEVWGTKGKGWLGYGSKVPGGVEEMRTISSVDIDQIGAIAKTQLGKPSMTRTETTKRFYDMLVGLSTATDVSQRLEILTAYAKQELIEDHNHQTYFAAHLSIKDKATLASIAGIELNDIPAMAAAAAPARTPSPL